MNRSWRIDFALWVLSAALWALSAARLWLLSPNQAADPPNNVMNFSDDV